MKNQQKLVSIAQYDGVGYEPIVDFGAWRVAILNYDDTQTPEKSVTFERHNETDEVFIALQGCSILYVGDGDGEIGAISAFYLEPNTAFNVKKGVWHATTCSEDAKMLIVENRDTADDNSDKLKLTEAQRARMRQLSDAL